MRSRLRLAAVLLAATLAAQEAAAEPIGPHFQLTPVGGFTIFDGNLRYPGTNPVTDDIYAGGRVGWQWKPWLGVEGAFGFTPTSEDVIGGKDVDFWHWSGDVAWSPWSTRWGQPFLLGGFGNGRMTAEGAPDVPMGLLSLGAGVRMWMTDAIGLRFEARQMSWLRDSGDQEQFNHMLIGAGLTFAIGAEPRDTDGDGVPDKKDTCPDTPKGATVDATGCPKDSDGDAVLDGLDLCPGTPKGCTVDVKGCPADADSDGVCNGVDQCADTPRGATVDATGCPIDTDGDGVFDGLDQCANTPKGATVDASGCPTDSDMDGVPDGIDLCPGTPPALRVDARGCPIEVIERETELLDTGIIRLENAQFETGKAVIDTAFYPRLDVLGQLLKNWPQLRVEIGGHTDSKGSAASNQKLSEARAKAVVDYLNQKFPELPAGQLTAKGYGESQPIAPNTTKEGMAMNRRMELKVINKEVLRKELERRNVIQKSAAPPDTTQQK